MSWFDSFDLTTKHSIQSRSYEFIRRGLGFWLPLEKGQTLFFALNGAFCGWPGRGERLLRAKLFWGGAGARNQVQSRAEYRCTLLSSSASSQRDLAAPL